MWLRWEVKWIPYLKELVDIIAYERASMISLPLDIEAIKALGERLKVGPISGLKFLPEEGLCCFYLFGLCHKVGLVINLTATMIFTRAAT